MFGVLIGEPIAAELAKPGVVDDDEEDVRRALFGAKRRRPGRLGFANRAAHAAGKCRARLIFLERHLFLPHGTIVNVDLGV